MTTLFCGNLPFSVTDEELNQHLRQHNVTGVTSAAVTMKNDRSKGWALVTFGTPQAATDAIAKLDNSDISGRPMRVRESRPAPDADSKPARNNNNNNSRNAAAASNNNEPSEPTNRLYVGNLPWDTTSEQLAASFAEFKPVSCEVQKRLSGKSKGFAIVDFRSVQDAKNALARVSTETIEGRALNVRFDRQSEKSSGDSSTRLFVGNLPWSVDDSQLAGMFAGFAVSSAKVKVVKERSRGFGIVELNSAAEAQRALNQKREFEFEGRTIFCRFDRD